MAKKQYYKFLYLKYGKMASAHKGFTWEIGKEYVTEGKVKACYNGFHASEYIQDALSYVQGEVLAVVECSGDSDNQSDKVCFEKMKIVKAYKWTATDSIAFAIYAAEQVIKIYEDKYPNDSRPRDAIKAAKAYLKEPNKKNHAADAARAAYAAADAAYAAAYAADAAAYAAAYAAARAARAADAAAYAADAAAYAADAAGRAADAAGRAELRAKLHRKAKSMIKHLEPLQ